MSGSRRRLLRTGGGPALVSVVPPHTDGKHFLAHRRRRYDRGLAPRGGHTRSSTLSISPLGSAVLSYVTILSVIYRLERLTRNREIEGQFFYLDDLEGEATEPGLRS